VEESSGSNRARPGLPIAHPLALSAVALLLLNDHVLKGLWPGLVTGKLSDVAGLAFFPALLESGWRVFRPQAADRLAIRRVTVAAIVSGLVFAAVKSAPAALGPSGIVRDTSDLIALPALVTSIWIASRPRKIEVATPRNRRESRRLEFAAILVAGIASMATSQGVISATLKTQTVEQLVQLTAERPIVVHQLTMRYAGTSGVDGVSSGVDMFRRPIRWPPSCCNTPPPHVRLLVVRDGRLEPFEMGRHIAGVDSDGPTGLYNSSVAATDPPTQCFDGRCERNLELIWRLEGDAGEGTVEIPWYGNAYLSYPGIASAPPGSEIHLEVNPIVDSRPLPVGLRATEGGHVTLTRERPSRIEGLALVLSREAVAAMAAHPEWATLRIQILNRTSEPGGYQPSITVSGSGVVGDFNDVSDAFVFPFQDCTPGAECRAAVLFAFNRPKLSNKSSPAPDPQTDWSIDWSAAIEIAFPDLSAVPNGATLTVEDLCAVARDRCSSPAEVEPTATATP
jgi:hypothetical protein